MAQDENSVYDFSSRAPMNKSNHPNAYSVIYSKNLPKRNELGHDGLSLVVFVVIDYFTVVICVISVGVNVFWVSFIDVAPVGVSPQEQEYQEKYQDAYSEY